MLGIVPFTRLHWPALTGGLALVVAVTAVLVLHPSHASRADAALPAARASAQAPPTRTVRISPVTADGVKKPSWRVTTQRHRGTCHAGSEAVGNGAYRCFSGNLVLDPCWAQADVRNARAAAHHVLCAASPWKRNVARVRVRHLPAAHGLPRNVWGIRLADGRRCTWLQGASGTHHGQRISYTCGGRLYLYGEPDRSMPRWRIGATTYRHGHFRHDHVVAIATAVRGHRSPAS